jgi:diacylglycerol kinase (ATP)
MSGWRGNNHVKTCVILNPAAGTAKNFDKLTERFAQHGFIDLRLTKKTGDAERFARAAVRRGCSLVVSAGGDGTLNEVVNGIAKHARDISVGIVPFGTGNDFARSLGLPNEFEAAIQIVKKGRRKAVDLVRVKSDRIRYFVNVSAGGFSGLVDEKLTPEIKRSWGPLAYLRSAAAALPSLRAYETEVKLRGHKPLICSSYNIIIGNGRYVAGGIPVAPKARLDDGLLDFILIPELPATEIAILVAQILMGKHLSNKSIVFHRATRVEVNSRPGMWFNVDGELVGNEPAVFEIMPRAIHFMVRRK